MQADDTASQGAGIDLNYSSGRKLGRTIMGAKQMGKTEKNS